MRFQMNTSEFVMAGLVPAIHDFLVTNQTQGVDARAQGRV